MTKLSKGESLPSSGQDLRKHLRFKIEDAATSFSIKGVTTSVGSGRVTRSRAAINLSEGGAMLLLCECVQIGTPLVVRIEIDGFEEFIEVEAVVRWCEQGNRNAKDFHTGIQFVNLSDSDLRRIGKMRDWFASEEYRSKQAGNPEP